MFKAVANLYLKATNKVNRAKSLINDCKRLIAEFDISGNNNVRKLKSNIESCDINSLVNKIETTKNSLMKLDQNFAGEYMSLLSDYLTQSPLDTSNMSEEERLEYALDMSIYEREYNETLLNILESNEGNLTSELEQQLEIQRKIVAGYEIEDKMAVLPLISEEYIKLYKEKSELDKEIIRTNPNLTPEEKENALAEYDTQYQQQLKALKDAYNQKVETDALKEELTELENQKANNNGFFHPFVESEIDDAILDTKASLGYEDAIAYKNMNGWERAMTDTKTFVVSTYTGLYNITEEIGDGFVGIGGTLHIVDRDWAQNYISRDLSGELYKGVVISTDMNEHSAYGTYHDAGLIFGETGGKIGMTFASPWVNAILCGSKAAGASYETSFNEGLDWNAASAKGAISFVGGAAEGYGMSKMNAQFTGMAKSGAFKSAGSNILNNIKGNTTALFTKEGAKTVIKNGVLLSVKDVDTWVETGCVIADNITDGITTGEWDVKQIVAEAAGTFGFNVAMNMVSGIAFDDLNKVTTDVDSTTSPDYDSTPVQTHRDPISGKTYTSYDEMLEHYESQRTTFESNLTPREQELFNNYCRESFMAEGNYKSVNGINRGTMIDYDAETISVIHTSGSVNKMTFEEFEGMYGESVEDFVIRQTQASIELNDALSKFSLDEDTTLYRGVNYDALQSYGITSNDSPDEIYRKLTANGHVYSDAGFMSTAVVSAGITDSKPIVFELNCEAGTTGALAESFNPYGENEFLLTAGQKFWVDSVEKVSGKYGEQIVVHMSSILKK